MAELVQNRSQRLQFDVSSPNGILLFRETSKIIFNYGSRILTLSEMPKESIYQMKLKGVSICFSMLKSALCGGYVNFGVFRLYGDTALDDALNIFVKLLLSIPQPDLLVSSNKCSSIYLGIEFFLKSFFDQSYNQFFFAKIILGIILASTFWKNYSPINP